MYYLSNLIFVLLSPTVLLLSREAVNAGMLHFSLNNFYLLSSLQNRNSCLYISQSFSSPMLLSFSQSTLWVKIAWFADKIKHALHMEHRPQTSWLLMSSLLAHVVTHRLQPRGSLWLVAASKSSRSQHARTIVLIFEVLLSSDVPTCAIPHVSHMGPDLVAHISERTCWE